MHPNIITANFSATQFQPVTILFIALELLMMVYHLPFLSKPKGYRPLWYLLLLVFLLLFNITNELFPDRDFPLGLRWQYIIAYGFAYLMGSYVPFYFYKAFGLERLRFHALVGVPVIDLGCFTLFNVLLYLWNGDIVLDSRLAVILPFVYGFWVLSAMYKSIQLQYKESHDRHNYTEQLLIFIAILPWQAMAIFAFWNGPQVLRMVMANLCVVVVTLLLIVRTFRHHGREYRLLAEFRQTGGLASLFEENCIKFKLTPREIEIAKWLKQGLTYKQIGEKLFISEHTVDNHVRNIYQKAEVKSKFELIQKLWNKV